jgi:hypothetical protein
MCLPSFLITLPAFPSLPVSNCLSAYVLLCVSLPIHCTPFACLALASFALPHFPLCMSGFTLSSVPAFLSVSFFLLACLPAYLPDFRSHIAHFCLPACY